jgi:PAS domain S-box-containing protein
MFSSSRSNRANTLRFIIPSVVAIAAFTFSIFFFFLPRVREIGIQQEREAIKELVQLPLNVCACYRRQAQSGVLSEEQAREKAAEVIRGLKYGTRQKDYFWILDTQPVLIMHPYRLELEGQNVADYRDREGNPVFMEMVETVEEQGSGFVTYHWQVREQEEEIGRKLSYVAHFEPWDWIIGTGMYLGEITDELAQITRSMLYVSLTVIAFIAGLLFFLTRQGISVQKGKDNVTAELARSKYYYRQLVELMQEGIGVQDTEGRFTFVNQQLCTMLGYTPEEIIGKKVTDFLREESRDTFLRHASRHRENKHGPSSAYRMEWETKNGTRLTTIVSPRILYNADNEYSGSFAVITNITDLQTTEEELTSLLQEKTVLLKEIHHRVKNNLQVIASLFNLQFQNAEDDRTKSVLYESQLRIQTISRVHEFLYQSENLKDIDMKHFLEQLVLDIKAVYYEHRQLDIDFTMDIDQLSLSVDKAVPVGLIMNELVSNAVKHAFPRADEGSSGTERKMVMLFLRNEAYGITFGVADNGRGFPENYSSARSPTLGLELITILTEQLNGDMAVRKGLAHSGSTIEIRIPA